MKSRIFIAVVLLSGFSAGIIHGLVNLAITEPVLEAAIGIENQNLFASGIEEDTPNFWVEHNAYRNWQKSGQILAASILGLSIGSLFGIVFAYSKNSLPAGNAVKKTLVLGGLMWFSLFLIPFLKYPANPPTVGDSETVVLRQTLFILFIAISGLGTLVFYKIYRKLQKPKKILAFLGYGIFIATVFIVMPTNPDEITAPIDIVNEFRMMSFIAVTVFWIANAIILGILWQRFLPDQKPSSEIN